MRRGNYIVTHEDFQSQEKADGSILVYPFEAFIGGHLIAKGFGPPPDVGQVQGMVRAYINEGRWVVDCPALCGGAVIPSLIKRVFMCPNCANLENDGKWYRVIFPPNFRQIETVLLKRPNKFGLMFPNHATNRNWRLGETVADLEQENLEHGIA